MKIVQGMCSGEIKRDTAGTLGEINMPPIKGPHPNSPLRHGNELISVKPSVLALELEPVRVALKIETAADAERPPCCAICNDGSTVTEMAILRPAAPGEERRNWK